MSSAPRGDGTEDSGLLERPFSLSPRAAVTPTLIGLNCAILVGLWVESWSPSGSTPIDRLTAWGGNFGPLTLSGEWWRLLSCSFVHSSLGHFISNMVGLWFGGNLLERRIGSPLFLLVYVASALLGSLASLAAHPEIVGHGASAAVLGVYAALFGLSFGRSRPAGQSLWVSDLFLSSFLIGLTLGRGYLDATIDNPGHLGGLATGLAYGLALRNFRPGGKRLWILAGTGAATLAVILAIAASLPRRVVVIDAEVRRYIATSQFLVDRFETMRLSRGGDGLPVGEFRKFIEFEILPIAKMSRSRLENVGETTGTYRDHIQKLIDNGRVREKEWELLVEEFDLLENMLDRLYQLETAISRAYLDVQGELEREPLQRDRASVRLFDETVDPWGPLIRDLSKNTGLRQAVQNRVDVLKEYADIRQRAWSLYAESVREQDAERASIANEKHRSANEMIENWTD